MVPEGSQRASRKQEASLSVQEELRCKVRKEESRVMRGPDWTGSVVCAHGISKQQFIN